MSFGRAGEQARSDHGVDVSAPLKVLRAAASLSVVILLVTLLALAFAPKDPGTLTLYGLVIGLNLVLLLAFWPVARWLQRLGR